MNKFLALCAIAGIGFAAQTDMQKLEERIANLELHSAMNTDGARLAEGKKDTAYGVTLGVDFLFWHPKTDYTEISSTVNSGTNNYNGSRTSYVDFDWEFGFRFDIGYHVSDSHWTVMADYTNVQFHDNYNVTPGGTNSLHLNMGEADYSNVPSTKGSHKIDYQTATLSLMTRFFVTPDVSLMPRFGAKATWINQIVHATHQLHHSSTRARLGDQNVNVTEKTKSLGPMGCLHSNWYLCNGWSVYADGGLALLFTSYSGRMSVEKRVNDNVFDSGHRMSNKEDKHYVTPNLMLNLGIAYEITFCDCDDYARISLGYESQYYINQSYLMQNRDVNVSNTYQGAFFARNLAVYGLTLSGTYAF